MMRSDTIKQKRFREKDWYAYLLTNVLSGYTGCVTHVCDFEGRWILSLLRHKDYSMNNFVRAT